MNAPGCCRRRRKGRRPFSGSRRLASYRRRGETRRESGYNVPTHRSPLCGEAVATQLTADVRHPAALAAAATAAPLLVYGGGVVDTTAASVEDYDFLGEDYSPVLEQDGRFALDA